MACRLHLQGWSGRQEKSARLYRASLLEAKLHGGSPGMAADMPRAADHSVDSWLQTSDSHNHSHSHGGGVAAQPGVRVATTLPRALQGWEGSPVSRASGVSPPGGSNPFHEV